MLGYTDIGYRVLINNRVIIARNCNIIEEEITLCGLEDSKEDQTEEDKNWKFNSKKKIITDKVNRDEMEDDKEEKEQRSKSNVKPLQSFDEKFSYYSINVNYCDAMTPKNFQEAITCENFRAMLVVREFQQND